MGRDAQECDEMPRWEHTNFNWHRQRCEANLFFITQNLLRIAQICTRNSPLLYFIIHSVVVDNLICGHVLY